MKLKTTMIVLVGILFGMLSDAGVTTLNKAYKKQLNDKYLKAHIEKIVSNRYDITGTAEELTKNKELMKQITKVNEKYRPFVYGTFALRIVMILLIAFLLLKEKLQFKSN